MVRCLAQHGMRPSEIARWTGISHRNVAADIAWLRDHDINVPNTRSVHDPQPHRRRTVAFSYAILAKLEAPAIARGLTTQDLAKRIVEIVAEADLFKAVLDD